MTQSAVCFHNPGTIDYRAFTMLGLSAKEGDAEGKIGFFGTGFKYGIAVFLRNNQYVQIVNSNNTYTFSIEKGTFRGKKHEFIKCHHERDGVEVQNYELPYTTHLGANWQMWQAYREFYTNALDESGGVVLVEDFVEHSNSVQEGDGVYIYVVGKEIEEVHSQRDKYFLNVERVRVICEDKVLRMLGKYDGSDNVVYYKGMYTGTKMERETYFTYDYVGKEKLTEDRTIKDTWSITYNIATLWQHKMSYDDLVTYLPRVAGDVYLEGRLSGYTSCSDDFTKACAHLVKTKRELPTWALRTYVKNRPISETLEKTKLKRHESVSLSRACSILRYNGIDIDLTRVTFVASLPDDQLGMYVRDEDHIYLNQALFEQGMPRLVGTLYEEWLHKVKEVDDCTREMQNMLVDKCAVMMERVYETDTTPGQE